MDISCTPKLASPFTPGQIVLDVNTPGDAAKLYFIFNYSPIIDTLCWNREAVTMRDAVRKLCPHVAEEFNDYMLKFKACHRELNK